MLAHTHVPWHKHAPYYGSLTSCFLKDICFLSTEHTCKDFRCTTKEFCIHPDLLCDKVNHCEDGSDETFGALCEGRALR